ncbi:MAG TPA: hypothetical protein VGK74_20810 [Symbiobacteriaceae bacterium]|jgi:hypothetical protein
MNHEEVKELLIKAGVLRLDGEVMAKVAKELAARNVSAEAAKVVCSGNYCIIVRD